MLYGQGQMETNHAGTKRESNAGRGRFDLLPFEAIEALAIWYEEGAKKYGDRNWEKGLSVSDCINRMIRHAIKAGNGWTDEDHLSAVMWNAAAAITMMERKPEFDDHRWLYKEPEEQTPLENLNLVAQGEVRLSKDDLEFLKTALESGGIEDSQILQDWINRRLYVVSK